MIITKFTNIMMYSLISHDNYIRSIEFFMSDIRISSVN